MLIYEPILSLPIEYLNFKAYGSSVSSKEFECQEAIKCPFEKTTVIGGEKIGPVVSIKQGPINWKERQVCSTTILKSTSH